MKNDLIYLIGPMGSGKSSVGKKLAEKLGLSWVDIDAKIVEQQASSIADIFAVHGEQYFRELEFNYLQSINEQAVVSTGGGLTMFQNAMSLMLRKREVIYLEVSPDVAIQRIHLSTERPLLSGNELEQKQQWMELFNQRKATYRQARIQMNANLPLDELVEQLVSAIANKQ